MHGFYSQIYPNVSFLLGVPDNVTTVVHLCCGYPSYLDHEGYKKADKQLYVKLASLLDKTGINQVIGVFLFLDN